MCQFKFDIIVACDQSWGIGKNGIIPWHFKKDLQWFRKKTSDSAIVMGYKTWLSLPKKPLPKRLNYVLTRNHHDAISNDDDVNVCKSLDELLTDIKKRKLNNVFIIGGAQIYNLFYEKGLVGNVCMTHIEKDFNCDVKFSIEKKSLEKVEDIERYQENDTTIKTVLYRCLLPQKC